MDYYKILKISEDATLKQIDQAIKEGKTPPEEVEILDVEDLILETMTEETNPEQLLKTVHLSDATLISLPLLQLVKMPLLPLAQQLLKMFPIIHLQLLVQGNL